MSIVNRAYIVETGDSGLAFKCTNRFKERSECQEAIPHTIVGTLEDGTIVCMGKGQVDKVSDSVDLGPLAVDPDYQGKGFGRELLEALESRATHQELCVVSCRDDVLEIYRKRGYVIFKTVPVTDIIPLDRLTRPDLKMHLMKKVNR